MIDMVNDTQDGSDDHRNQQRTQHDRTRCSQFQPSWNGTSRFEFRLIWRDWHGGSGSTSKGSDSTRGNEYEGKTELGKNAYDKNQIFCCKTCFKLLSPAMHCNRDDWRNYFASCTIQMSVFSLIASGWRRPARTLHPQSFTKLRSWQKLSCA